MVGVQKSLSDVIKKDNQLSLQHFSIGNISDSMTIPHYTPNLYTNMFWRPNNYRRQMRVKERKISPQEMKDSGIIVPTISYGKVISIKGLAPNITLQLGKKNLIGIYSQDTVGKFKTIYKLEAKDNRELDKRIEAKKQAIADKIDKVMYSFARRLDILIPFIQPKWLRAEDFIKGEEFINKIPEETIIHDTVFKKVYPKGIEFISKKGEEPTASLKNYIKNRALENLAPMITKQLNCMVGILDRRYTMDKNLAENIARHLNVMNRIDEKLDKLNNIMDKFEKAVTNMSQWKLKL